MVVALAAAAGVVIENALLYEEAARREQWLEATAEIAGVAGRRGQPRRRPADRRRPGPAGRVRRPGHRGGARRGRPPAGRGGVRWRPPAGPAPGAAERALHAGRHRDRDRRDGRRRRRPDRRPGRPRPVPEHWPAALGPMVLVPLRTPGRHRGSAHPGVDPRPGDRVPRPRRADARAVRRPGRPGAAGRPGPRGPREARRLRGPGPDRPRPARPGDPAAVRDRARPGEHRADRRSSPTSPTGSPSAVDDIDETIKDIRRSIFALSVATDSTDLRATVGELVERAAKVLGFRPDAASSRGRSTAPSRRGPRRTWPRCWGRS